MKWSDNELQLVSAHPILGPDGEPVCGFLPLDFSAETKEAAFIDMDGTKPKDKKWFFDLEGISRDSNGDFWLVDEYRPAVILVDGNSFRIREMYSPVEEPGVSTNLIDSIFMKRKPNRGFEGVCITPSGKIMANLQSPVTIKDKDLSVIHLLMIDPATRQTKIFAYRPGNLEGAKIGDITSINENEFLLIEHGMSDTGKVSNIIRINIENATDLNAMMSGKLEKFNYENIDSLIASNTVHAVEKELFFNLIEAGLSPENQKPEGIAILDSKTFVINNDNDFGIDGISSEGNLMMNNQESCLFIWQSDQQVFDIK